MYIEFKPIKSRKLLPVVYAVRSIIWQERAHISIESKLLDIRCYHRFAIPARVEANIKADINDDLNIVFFSFDNKAAVSVDKKAQIIELETRLSNSNKVMAKVMAAPVNSSDMMEWCKGEQDCVLKTLWLSFRILCF